MRLRNSCTGSSAAQAPDAEHTPGMSHIFADMLSRVDAPVANREWEAYWRRMRIQRCCIQRESPYRLVELTGTRPNQLALGKRVVNELIAVARVARLRTGRQLDY